MKKYIDCLFACTVIISSFVLFSCSKNKVVASLEAEKLFDLQYGNFEDQINLNNLTQISDINLKIIMKDGFFYLTDPVSKKIIKSNSYGNLLNLYYNRETNPDPQFTKMNNSTETTRSCSEYAFNEIASIAVDNRKYLYVVDSLPPERQEVDENTKQVMTQIVLRFDGDGNFIDYLGQQGPGGTPFPSIVKIFATQNNEIVVFSRTSDGYKVYWFSSEGTSLFIVPFNNSMIPNPYENESGIDNYINIDQIVPDYSKYMLYVKADYSVSYIDEATKVQSGIDYKESLLYPFNVETGVYEKAITIPPYSEKDVNGLSTVSYNIPYDFIGITDSGWFFFMIGTETGFSIQMVQPNGQKILNRTLQVNPAENYYYEFNLSEEGILSVMLAQKDNIVVEWWRTDNLIDAIIKQ